MLRTKQNFDQVTHLVVDSEHRNQRIDNFLLGLLKGVPRSYVYRILRSGEVRVNKGRVRPLYRLQPGDVIRLPPTRSSSPGPATSPGKGFLKRLETSILFEDDRFLALNKPAGTAVHGGSGVSFGVIEGLRALRPDSRHLELVHRLDRETSGCLLISKKRSALRVLHELLRRNEVDKRYLALLAGAMDAKVVDVRVPLKKNVLLSGERMVSVDNSGKPAHTRFTRQRRFENATLAEVRLFTGRTHQIRVHAAHIGAPVLGDTKYGDAASNQGLRGSRMFRLYLHARALRFRWPGEEKDIYIEAPLDNLFSEYLEKQRDIE